MFTCIACEFKFSQDEMNTEERLCNDCIDEIYEEIDDYDMQKSWLKSPQFKKIINDIESQVDGMSNKDVADVIAILNNYRLAFQIVKEHLDESDIDLPSDVMNKLTQLMSEGLFKKQKENE
tara:strand:- start:21100 stop:21462 length:363 start_codon:yes stop_codon:yes gene_type:complete